MQLWFVRIVLSTLWSAFGDFLTKFLFEKYPKLTVAWSMTYGRLLEIVWLCIFILVSGRSLMIRNESRLFLWLLLLSLLIRFVANKLYVEGIKKLDVSFVAIIFTFSTIVSVIWWILFHAETVTVLKFLGVFLIMSAIVAVNYVDLNEEGIKQKKYIWFILASACIYGVVANIEKIVWLDFDPFVFRFRYSLCSVWLFCLFYPKDLKQDLIYI